MTKQSHTPGPWTPELTIPAHDDFPATWQINATDDAVCTTQFCYAPETEANARLIAAAPDMFDAAQALFAVNDEFERRRTLGVARAVEELAGAGGLSGDQLRAQGVKALADLRAALSKALGQDGESAS